MKDKKIINKIINIDNISTKEYTSYTDCIFINLDLTDLIFYNIKFSKCSFINCKLNNTNFISCVFYNCDFISNEYIENNWYNNYGKNLKFVGALPNFIKENTFLNLKVIQ